MDSMQRQFGKMMSKGGIDDAKVSVLLQDFTNADQMLATIIESSNVWRDAWIAILNGQLGVVAQFEELYNPIIGATSDGYGHEPALTPQLQLDRTSHLKRAYDELKTDLLDEVNMVDTRIIRPATDAKECIQPLKKTIKKRENRRLDYERHHDRVVGASRKVKRSEREDAALVKMEAELAKATDAFNVADDHLRQTLPSIIAATFSLLPHLLAAQVMTQNTLLAQYYTTLHNYCSDQGISSPAPPIDDIIAQWNSDFKPVQQQIESVNILARGKAVHAPMHLGDDSATRKGSSLTGLNLRNGIAARRASSQNTLTTTSTQSRTSPGFGSSRSHSFGPSSTSGTLASQKEYDEAEVDLEPQPYNLHYPQYTTPPYTPGLSSRDEFDRQSTHSSIASSVAGKKKPPPPPPKPKRIQSDLGLWVTALYGFDGQEADDLTFREGDRIKVLKKTDSTDDWWDGEMAGRRGKFPANYVQLP